MDKPPRFPDIHVDLSEHDGNAYFIMARVAKALRRHGVDEGQIEEYRTLAMLGDYDNLLQVTMEWVDVG